MPDIYTLCAHVSMGGSPVDFAAAHKIRYCDLIDWLFSDTDRQKKYDNAMVSRNEWFIQRIVLELHNLVVADIRDAFSPDGTAKKLSDLSPQLAACISSITVDDNGNHRIRFRTIVDKIKSLELLGKSLSMFVDRHDLRVSGSVTVMPEITVDNKPLRYNIGSPN